MAETINGFLDGLEKAKQKGQAILAKINSGKAPTEAEVKQLAKNEAYNLKTMEAAVAAFKKRNQAGIDQQALDQINALMVDKRAALAVLNTYKPTTRPEEIQAAVASIAGTNPPEIDKTIKRIPALEIEYNGKRYGDGKSINVEYSTFSKAFYLKNGVENAETSWILKNPASDVIKSFSGNLSSVDINFSEIIQGQELYNEQGLYFEITQDTRKLKVNIVTQKLILTGMTITDARHRGRTATEGQTLYLVGHGGIKATVTATGFKSPFENPNLSWSITNSNVTNPRYILKDKSELNYDLGVTPVGIDRVRWEVEARNTLGTSKNIDVVVVDYYRTKHQVLPKSIENGINDVFTGFNSLNDAIKEFTKKDILTIKPKLTVNGSWYNEENPKSNLYYDAKEGGLDASLAVKVKVPLPPPYSQDLYIPLIGTIGKIGVFIDVDIDFGATAALKYEKYVNESEFKMINSNAGGKATGGITAGGEVKVLPGNSTFSAEGKVYGKSSLTGDIKYNFTTEKITSKIFLDPLAFGVSGYIKISGKTVWDDKYETQLLNRFIIYDSSK